MTDRELMQMALDALEHGLPIIEDFGGKGNIELQHKAIAVLYEALRAALANEFNPDWDAMAVMVEEQQRMAKRIEELKERLLQVELNPPTARLAKPEQEPVAQVDYNERGNIQWLFGKQVPDKTLLYTASQREWQGLTDEEIEKCYLGSFDEGQFARAIEAKLKEKNHG